jgi:plasmid stabilization system protein ParE
VKIHYSETSLDDLRRGREFYQLQGGPELGDYFFDSLFSDIDSLILYGGIHRKIYGLSRLRANRFPYSIYYVIENEEITVARILDDRQDPERTRCQLTGN